MPRLTKQQLEEVRYVSLDDFIYRINQISNIDDKVAFATRYLLDYGHNENPDVPFYQALYVARAKIADASYDLKETFNEDEEIDKGEYLGYIVNVLNPYATDES
jgi:putative lipase involved disintegration of autophagic bodies